MTSEGRVLRLVLGKGLKVRLLIRVPDQVFCLPTVRFMRVVIQYAIDWERLEGVISIRMSIAVPHFSTLVGPKLCLGAA